MNILIACEYSGRIRNAFAAKGHNVVSCDLLPAEWLGLGHHVQGDVRDLLYSYYWDMIIAHPECTYMCNSGSRWLWEDCSTGTAAERWLNLTHAMAFFHMFQSHPCKKKAIENPVPHKHAVRGFNGIPGIGNYTQTIQPYDFKGETESKRTALWLTGLPKLKNTQKLPKHLITRDGHNATPGPDRWKDRSRSFQGIADAMADQWG